MAVTPVKQANVASNRASQLVFFEGQELAYNYKTNQWSQLTAYDGIGLYSINSNTKVIGLNRVLGTAIGLQEPGSGQTAQDATITTGERDINQGGRAIVTGVRPLVTGGNTKVSVIYKDDLNPPTRTNAFTYSEEFDDSDWAKTQTSITANDTTAPDNTETADKMTESASGAATRFIRQTPSVTSGAQYTVSVFANAADLDFINIRLNNVATWVTYDVSTGAVGSTADTGGFGDLLYGIESSNNGFYRAWLTFVPPASNVTVDIYMAPTDIFDSSFSYTGAGSEGLHLWGSMLETGRLAEYFKSEASAGTSTEYKTLPITPNSRTDVANFRAEARFHKAETTITEGFTTAMGADLEFSATGRV